MSKLHLAHHLSLGSSMVRASHRSSEGCGFDPHLGLGNHFLSIELDDLSSLSCYDFVVQSWVCCIQKFHQPFMHFCPLHVKYPNHIVKLSQRKLKISSSEKTVDWTLTKKVQEEKFLQLWKENLIQEDCVAKLSVKRAKRNFYPSRNWSTTSR